MDYSPERSCLRRGQCRIGFAHETQRSFPRFDSITRQWLGRRIRASGRGHLHLHRQCGFERAAIGNLQIEHAIAAPSASPFAPAAAGMVQATVTGPRSGVTGQVLVWTPPGYSPSGPPLPVLLSLNGYPGNPIDAINGLGMPTAIPQLIASGALPSMIVVAASTNIGGKDWGCADAPGGPRVDTWLTRDVRELVQANFQVLGQSRWSVLGLSSGGTCAVRLTLLHPDAFGAAVGMAGSNAPDSPALTVDRETARANNLLTLVAAGAPRDVSLLLAVSRTDPGTLRDAQALQKAVGPHVTVDIAAIEHGGHNWAVWAAMTPRALTWLGQHLDR